MTGRMRGLLIGGAILAVAGCQSSGNPLDDLSALLAGDAVAVAEEEEPAAPIGQRLPQPAIDGVSTWSGQRSAAFNDLTATARDERGWQLLWQLVGEPAPEALPANAMALGVFLGRRPTGGYSVEITDVAHQPEAVVARYREITPDPDAVVTQALTAPYTIELVQASPLPVQYIRIDETGDPLATLNTELPATP